MNIKAAIISGNSQDLVDVLASGEDPNQHDEHGFAPIHWGIMSDAVDESTTKIERLLACGANPHELDATGRAPISFAVERGKMDVIELLLRHGASLRAVSDCGSLVADAVLGGHGWLIPFLVRGGADVNLISRDGFAPLMLAAGNGMEEAIPILLDAGAEVDARDSRHGLTAYLHAALTGNREAAGILLSAGANPDAVTNEGETAAKLAAQNGHVW